MEALYRKSPVQFDIPAVQTEEREGWTVVLEYAQEQDGPLLVDLSHLPRWDVQDKDLAQYRPAGVDIPGQPGESTLQDGILVHRMNRTQAAIWHLVPTGQAMPDESAYTDIRENTVCLAVIGPGSLAVSEKVTNLDLADPKRTLPCLIQGPLGHVPCQIALLGREDGKAGFVLTCSRGYARDMVHVLLEAGKEFGLHPGGEQGMARFLETV